MIDVERLLILREVARHGSKAAAARALTLSEPTVAHHLRALERRAGVPLTMRSGRVTRLTPTGEALLRHADSIAASLEDAERCLHRHSGLQVGRLRIATFTSFAATVLPRPLAMFARTYPGVEVGFEEKETDDALAMLRAGEADLAISFSDSATPAPEDLPLVELERDEYLAILPASHPLAGRDRIDLGSLADERWISGCVRCRTHLVAHAADAGFAPNIAFLTEDYVAAQRLIAEELGVALLPRMALDASPAIPGIVAIPTQPPTYRDIFVAMPAEPAPAAAAFAELLTGGSLA
ncbi:LysR family transcriptional regulator [Demequina sp. SYSU T00039]|uniref:LysR family transcriptional regulator n=1 Tax=Demequina lignilytica TaxID=3051663 RepID=A0AAW7M903_9MICO|nr:MULTISPECIES: LysR family transcriptional regulator [unclassified Demequina]MDN4477962.1 LysR family transcriptional regulator [Demequina sp. SYSU T00039-1]MDN4487871.1 LysR family transcriptional regulator [Demequina sp. SYSU T00039]MDN4490746.1 LysR family transcriptional regulator [Demequina sp. SYSU T00068]